MASLNPFWLSTPARRCSVVPTLSRQTRFKAHAHFVQRLPFHTFRDAPLLRNIADVQTGVHICIDIALLCLKNLLGFLFLFP